LKPPSIKELDDDTNQPAVAGLVSCPEKNSPMKLPPSAAFRLKNQSPSCLVREGQWLKSEPPVTKRIQSQVEGHEADSTKCSIQHRDDNECEEGGEIDKDNGPDEEETGKPLEIDDKWPPDEETKGLTKRLPSYLTSLCLKISRENLSRLFWRACPE
jgi:hypothetical protein